VERIIVIVIVIVISNNSTSTSTSKQQQLFLPRIIVDHHVNSTIRSWIIVINHRYRIIVPLLWYEYLFYHYHATKATITTSSFWNTPKYHFQHCSRGTKKTEDDHDNKWYQQQQQHETGSRTMYYYYVIITTSSSNRNRTVIFQAVTTSSRRRRRRHNHVCHSICSCCYSSIGFVMHTYFLLRLGMWMELV